MKLSKDKKDRISEQIILYLFYSFPTTPFTAQIAKEVIRDEEFIKKILNDLKEKNIVASIRKNKKGIPYVRKIMWKLTNQAYDAYKLSLKR